jgi:hypothetical protein
VQQSTTEQSNRRAKSAWSLFELRFIGNMRVLDLALMGAGRRPSTRGYGHSDAAQTEMLGYSSRPGVNSARFAQGCCTFSQHQRDRICNYSTGNLLPDLHHNRFSSVSFAHQIMDESSVVLKRKTAHFRAFPMSRPRFHSETCQRVGPYCRLLNQVLNIHVVTCSGRNVVDRVTSWCAERK